MGTTWMTVLLVVADPKMINMIQVTLTNVVPTKVVVEVAEVALVAGAVKERDPVGKVTKMLMLMSQ
jgi:hypothetical protein